MSKYQQRLLDHIGNNPEFITPERYRNEVLSFLSEPLEDLCISRPTSRLTWGIPLPFDADFVTYVWFDALINYLTGIGYPDAPGFAAYWDAAEHLIAKDILKPHAIYWPTMLMAIGLKPFRKLHVHGYWNVDDTKMSKSLGNVVRPAELVGEYGIDALRYFTLREMSFGLDSSFGHEAIVSRMNADLANDLGNLFSRSLAMLEKYCRCIVPEASAYLEDSDRILIAAAERMFDSYRVNMDSFQFHKALQAVWELVGQANKYVVVNEPWALAKDEAKVARLNTVLYNLAESLRILALVLSPVMPGTAAKMAGCLGFGDDDPLVSQLEVAGRWGMYPPGKLVSLVASLFPRVDRKIAVAVKGIPDKNTSKTEKKESKMEQGLVAFDDFSRIEIQVAEILSARKVENSDRLLLLTVMAREQRTIVAGIAAFYNPEELIGRQVLVVANLTPAKIKGIRSEGMLLVAKTREGEEERLVLATVSSPVKNGSRVA
jgi:methionyl-tRNA synthetase